SLFGHRLPGKLDVASAVGRVGQEVEHGPVVPDVEGANLGALGHISDDPANPLGTLAEPSLCLAEGGLGNIEDRDFPEREVKEPIDQDRGPATHIADSPPLGGGDSVDEFDREARLVLIPAHARLGLGRVDVLPMLFAVGGYHGAYTGRAPGI